MHNITVGSQESQDDFWLYTEEELLQQSQHKNYSPSASAETEEFQPSVGLIQMDNEPHDEEADPGRRRDAHELCGWVEGRRGQCDSGQAEIAEAGATRRADVARARAPAAPLASRLQRHTAPVACIFVQKPTFPVGLGALLQEHVAVLGELRHRFDYEACTAGQPPAARGGQRQVA